MTLCVASVFPPDEFAGWSYKSMPFKHPSGVALCTDSRLTYVPGGTRDIGNKVFQIVPGIAMVYAGEVAVADMAIKRLAKIVSRDHMASPIHKIRRIFASTFRKAYSMTRSANRGFNRHNQSTQFLVGCYSNRTAQPFLTKFSSPDFEPVVKRTVSVIGSTEPVRRLYVQRLEEARKRSGSWPGSVMGMAGLLSVTLGEIIESQVDPHIGGVTEVVTLDSNGTHVVSQVTLDDEMNRVQEISQEGAGWVKKDAEGRPVSRTGVPSYSA